MRPRDPEPLQFLIGITPIALLKLLARHRFRIERGRLRQVGQLFFVGVLVSLCNLLDRLLLARTPRQHPFSMPPPLFIVGHWRSGTTFLHKLLALDPSLHAPSFFECCLPRGFLSGAGILKQRIAMHLPLDQKNVPIPHDIDEPAEDELVMAKEALISPMLEAVFPLDGERYRNQLNIAALAPTERQRWESRLLDFAWRLSLHHKKRLLFKSPAHSFRITQLRQLFPGSKFIVLHRERMQVIASTLKLNAWLLRNNALQTGHRLLDSDYLQQRYDGLELALHSALPALPSEDVAHVKFDQLIRDPTGAIHDIYRQLALLDSPARRHVVSKGLTKNQRSTSTNLLTRRNRKIGRSRTQ